MQATVGRPADTLPEFARALQASLVVMGAVSKGTLELLFIGNTAERVLDDLSCDVLVVKRGRGRRSARLLTEIEAPALPMRGGCGLPVDVSSELVKKPTALGISLH